MVEPMMYGTMSYLHVDGKILMIDKTDRPKDPNSGLFTLPGGKLEDWEIGTNDQGRLESAVRETEDETGLTLINPILRGVILFDNEGRVFDNWENPQNYQVYIFSAEKCRGELKEEGTEEGVPKWVDESLMGLVPKNAGDERMYKWLKDGRSFSGVIRHIIKEIDERGTMVDYFD